MCLQIVSGTAYHKQCSEGEVVPLAFLLHHFQENLSQGFPMGFDSLAVRVYCGILRLVETTFMS